MLIATATDTSGVPPYPLLEDVVSFKDITEPTTLAGHANSEVTARATPIETVPTVAQAGPDTGLGSYITGDEITVRGHDGYVEVDDRVRIIEIAVTVDDQGGENVAIALQPASDFA